MTKRNYEWPDASTFDGFFTIDKPGGITERVSPSMLLTWLQAQGALLNPLSEIDFNLTSPNPSNRDGRLTWDAISKSVKVLTADGPALELGREGWIRGKNTSGAQIMDGEVVYIGGGVAGATDTVADIKLAQSDTRTTCKTIAIATQDVDSNEEGEFAKFGFVRGINTSALTIGPVFVDPVTPGKVTNVEPSFPAYSAQVGVCLKVHATDGIILVDPDTDPILQSGGTPVGIASGGATFPKVLGNQARIFSQGSSNWGYYSCHFSPGAPIVANTLFVYCLQPGTLQSMRIGIYSQGASDVKLMETVLKTTPLVNGLNGLALPSEFVFVPGVEYQLSLQISANGTQLVFDDNALVNPNPPTHFGREDVQNAGNPAGGMVSPVGYSKTSSRPWIGVS